LHAKKRLPLEQHVMSDTSDTRSKSAPKNDTSVKRTLAHVERWMAVIREIANGNSDQRW